MEDIRIMPILDFLLNIINRYHICYGGVNRGHYSSVIFNLKDRQQLVVMYMIVSSG